MSGPAGVRPPKGEPAVLGALRDRGPPTVRQVCEAPGDRGVWCAATLRPGPLVAALLRPALRLPVRMWSAMRMKVKAPSCRTAALAAIFVPAAILAGAAMYGCMGGADAAPINPPEAGPAAADVLARLKTVRAGLSAYAAVSVTLEREERGWCAKDAHLFRDRADGADSSPDLRQVSQLTTLESLAIAGTYGTSTCRVTEEGLGSLRPLKRLRRLSLYRLSGRLDLKALSELPELEDLDLHGAAEDSDSRDLVHLRDLAKLRRLNLAHRKLSDSALVHVEPLRNLEALNLEWNPITDAGLARLKSLGKLQELRLGGTNITDAGLASLGSLRDLRVLDVSVYVPGEPSAGRLTGAGLSALKGLVNLRELSIGSLEVSRQDLLVLKNMPHLERLHIYGRISGVDGKVDLSFLEGLRELYIGLDVGEAEIVLPQGLERLVDVAVEQVRWPSLEPSLARRPRVALAAWLQHGTEALPLLQGLSNPVGLRIGIIGDADTKSLAAGAPRDLRSLNILTCPAPKRQMTDAGLKDLAGLERLESLEIPSYGEFSGEGVAELRRLPNLQRLRLDNLTVDGVARLGDLKELRWLSLSLSRKAAGAPLPTIDAALAQWRTLERLEELAIRGAALTDEGLKHLAELSSLRTLDLTGCSGFTDEGLASLLALSPKLTTVRLHFAPAARSSASSDGNAEEAGR